MNDKIEYELISHIKQNITEEEWTEKFEIISSSADIMSALISNFIENRKKELLNMIKLED